MEDSLTLTGVDDCWLQVQPGQLVNGKLAG